jgi:hypothetical protein
MLAGITVGATLACLTIWSQWADGYPRVPFHFYGHVRLFGLHMMVGTMTALALLVESHPRPLQRLAIGLCAAINCGGMLWSGGRAGVLGVAVALVVWYWRSPQQERRILRYSVPSVVVAGLAISLIQWSPESYLGWWNAAARSTVATSVNELSSTRLSFWQQTWQQFLQSPWIGHGADAYRFITPKLDGSQPHNWALQFLLDFGVVGAFALGALLMWQTFRGLKDRWDLSPAAMMRRGTAAGLVACLVTGLFDGVFYHAIALLPAAILVGIAGAAVAVNAKRSPEPAHLEEGPSSLELPAKKIKRGDPFRVVWPCLAASAAVLAVHAYLYLHLIHLPPPAGPQEFPARVLRLFPSTTYGLERWLPGWRPSQEDAVLEWTLWAQRHSDNPARLHLYAAVLYADRDDYDSADHEMVQALRTAHWTAQKQLAHFRTTIRDAELAAAARAEK